MNLKAGYPFWLVKDGLLYNYPAINADKKTTVLVLGGGISGALVAWQLVKAGVDCIVADARSIGLGSTCASTSLLQYEIDTPLCKLQHLVGLNNAVKAYKMCREAIYELADTAKEIKFAGYEFKQSLYYAAHEKDIPFLHDEFKIRKEHGFDVKMMDATAVKNKFGFAAPAILSKDGAQTNAYQFAHHLLQAGIKKGLQVYDRTKAIKINHHKKGVTVQTENGYTITASRIVYATGYESVKYIKKKIVSLKSTFASISESMADERPFWSKDVLIWNTASPYLYMRSTSDNRILVGGRDEDFYDPARRDQLISRKAKQLAGDFKKVFPAIPFKPEFNWAGTFGATKDGLPYIGSYTPLPHSYFALGFGGNGITFSQAAAVIITDLVQGKRPDGAEVFSFDR